MTSKNTDLPLLDQLLTTRLDDKNSEATQGKSVPDCLNYPYAVLTWFEPEVVSCKGRTTGTVVEFWLKFGALVPPPPPLDQSNATELPFLLGHFRAGVDF